MAKIGSSKIFLMIFMNRSPSGTSSFVDLYGPTCILCWREWCSFNLLDWQSSGSQSSFCLQFLPIWLTRVVFPTTTWLSHSVSIIPCACLVSINLMNFQVQFFWTVVVCFSPWSWVKKHNNFCCGISTFMLNIIFSYLQSSVPCMKIIYE